MHEQLCLWLRSCRSCNCSRWREVLLVTLEVLAFKMADFESLYSCFFSYGNCILVLKILRSKKYFKPFLSTKVKPALFHSLRRLGTPRCAVKMAQQMFFQQGEGSHPTYFHSIHLMIQKFFVIIVLVLTYTELKYFLNVFSFLAYTLVMHICMLWVYTKACSNIFII